MHPAPANTPPTLWDIAREALTLMSLAISGPAALMALAKLTRKGKREILDWLTPLEVLVRKLLLIQAAKLPRPAPQKPYSRPLTAQHARNILKRRNAPKKIYVSDPNRPHTWRVSFRIPIPRDPFRNKVERDFWRPMVRDIGPPMLIPQMYRELAARRALEAKKARLEKRRANTIRRLAERYEAVRRVLNNPTPVAERLARRLYRKNGSALRLAKAPPPRRHQVFVEPIKVATREAIDAAPTFNKDSS